MSVAGGIILPFFQILTLTKLASLNRGNYNVRFTRKKLPHVW